MAKNSSIEKLHKEIQFLKEQLANKNNANSNDSKLRTRNMELESELSDLKAQIEILKKDIDFNRALFYGSPTGFICTNSTGKIKDFNQVAANLFGNELMSQGKYLAEFLSADEKLRYEHYLNKVFSSNKRLSLELVLVNSNSVKAIILYSVRDPDRKLCYTTVFDITNRKGYKDQLLRQRDFAESIIETAQAIILILDLDGNIVRVNSFFENLTGYKQSEITGKDWINTFIPKHERDRIVTIFNEAIHGRRTKGSINTILTRDGNERIIEWYDTELTDSFGKTNGIIAIGQDVSDRILAESSLIESEKQLSLITNTLPVLVAYVDTNKKYIFNNKMHQTWFFQKSEEINGQHIKIIFGADSYRKLLPLIQSALDGNQVSGELRLEFAENQVRHVIVNFIPTLDQSGQTDGFIMLMIDVSNMKREEESTNKHLMDMTQKYSLNMMSEIATVLAHEINQPLTAISNYTSALIRMLNSTSLSNGQFEDVLRDINSEVVRTSQIVQHLRNFTQKREIQLKKTDINELILNVKRLFNRQIETQDLNIEINLMSPTVTIDIDNILIEQVITNIIQNSLDAIEEANIVYAIITLASSIDENGKVVIKITDNGPGMPDETMMQIFKPFFTTKKNGIGLGLSMCQSIIDLHNGNLWANQNQHNSGITFSIELPCSQNQSG